jgi:hypothetical protein
VGIGASAGGLEAFTQLLGHLPTDSGMAFVFVPHLPPSHASMMPEILARASKMRVREVENGMRIEANHVYVIPPRKHLSMMDGQITLAEFERQRELSVVLLGACRRQREPFDLGRLRRFGGDRLLAALDFRRLVGRTIAPGEGGDRHDEQGQAGESQARRGRMQFHCESPGGWRWKYTRRSVTPGCGGARAKAGGM